MISNPNFVLFASFVVNLSVMFGWAFALPTIFLEALPGIPPSRMPQVMAAVNKDSLRPRALATPYRYVMTLPNPTI